MPLRHPRRVLVALLLLTLLLLPLAARLRIEGNVIDLLPRSSPAAQAFATLTRGLVAGQELVILVLCDDPQRLLRFADAYVEELRRASDTWQVSHRLSAASLTYLREHLLLLLTDEEREELRRRLEPSALREGVRRLRALLLAPGGSSLAPVLTADPLQLVPLVSRRLSAGLPVDASSGYFRTADGRALLIKVRPGYNPMEWRRDRQLLQEVARIARRLGAQVAGDRIPADLSRPVVAFTGAYAYPAYYRVWIEQDLHRSTTLSLGAVLLLFALVFRAVRILPLVVLPLLCAGLWTAAVAAVLYGRINGVSVAFGTILVAIGIDLPIQIYNRLREELLHAPTEPADAIRRTVAALRGPSIVATLGPAAVFVCCGLSDYRGLRELGVLAAVGLCLNCVAMLWLFPALLLLLPQRLWHGPRTQRADQRRAAAGDRGALVRLARLGAQRPRLVLMAAAILGLLCLPLALRLGFERRLFSLEPRQMPPAVAQDEIARRFGDRQRFVAAVLEDPDPERALYRGDLWMRAGERLRQQGQLRGYEAIATLVPSARTQVERRAALRELDLPQAADRLERILAEEGFDPAPFSPFLRLLRQEPPPLTLQSLVGTELAFLLHAHVADLAAEADRPPRRLVAIYLFVPADEDISATLQALREVARGEAGGQLTGMPLLETELLGLVERDARLVTLASVALVVLLLLLYYRRWRPVLAVLLPLSLAWTLFAALLVVLRMPLNLYNLLCIPLCIGYGIDDHVFLVHRHLQSPPGQRDPVTALRTTGRAIVLTSLATMVGFAGLLVSHFEGLRLLGLSGALAVLLCLGTACAVLPAMLRTLLG